MNPTKQEVFREMYTPCHQAFLRYCRGLTGDRDDALDLAGETALIVFENLERLRKKDSFKAYLFSVARRLRLQHYRKIRFRVFDMAGRALLDDGAPESYSEGGKFNHQIDIAKLQGGFYVLVLTDESGAKLTRRFIKK